MPKGYPLPQIRLRALTLNLVFALLACAASKAPAQNDEADDLKSQTDRWLELERRIASERNQWRTEKEILQTSLQVLNTEQTTLKSKLEANEMATELFRKRLDQTQSDVAEQEAGHQVLATSAGEIEARIQKLVTRLPQPLVDTLQPNLEKLGKRAGDDALSPAERTQTLVSILSSIDAFNNTLTLTHQLRNTASGATLDVKVLYWGLAMGFAVDEPGTHAWLLIPGENGWTWNDQSASAGRIRALLDIYEKQQRPGLIELPIKISGGAQ